MSVWLPFHRKKRKESGLEKRLKLTKILPGFSKKNTSKDFRRSLLDGRSFKKSPKRLTDCPFPEMFEEVLHNELAVPKPWHFLSVYGEKI